MAGISIGSKVSVKGKLGTVRFVGTTQFAPGTWIGVELTQPIGKNDGSVNGVRYFKCAKPGNYGLFALPTIVQLQDAGTTKETSPAAVAGSTLTKEHLVIEKLQHKLQAAVGDIRQYRAQVSRLEAKIAEYKEMEDNLDQIIVERDFLESENQRIREKLAEVESTRAEIQKELAAAKEELEINKELEDEIRLVGTEVDDVATLVQKNKKLELVLANLKGVSQTRELELHEEVDHLKKSLDASSSQLSTLIAKFKAEEQTSAHLKAQLESIDQSSDIIDRLTTENDQLTLQIASLKAQIDELVELQELDKNLEDHHGQIEQDLRQTIHELEKRVIDEKKQKEQIENSRKELENKVLNLSSLSARDDDTPIVDASLSKKLEAQTLQLNQKTRDLKYIGLLLSVAESKLKFYSEDSADKRRVPLCPLRVLRDYIQDESLYAMSTLEKVKLYHLEQTMTFLGRVCDEIATLGNSELAAIDIMVNEMLLHVKDDTLVAYGADRVENVTRDLIKTIDSNTVYNRVCQWFISYECSILRHFVSLLPEAASETVASITEHVEETIKKLNVDIEGEVFERYDIKMDETFRTRISRHFGTYDPGNDYELSDEDYAGLKALDETVLQYDSELDTTLTAVPETQDQTKEKQEPSPDLELTLTERNKVIEDLQLTLKLLENNMTSMTVAHRAKVKDLQEEVAQLKSKHKEVKTKFEALERRNKVLEEEVQSLITSGKYFDVSYVVGKFDDIESEKAFVNNVKLLEEISYLRTMVASNTVEDLAWLDTPCTTSLAKRTEPNLQSISKRLQHISKSVEVLPLTKGKWVQKKENPKFVQSTIEYHLRLYENDRNKVLL